MNRYIAEHISQSRAQYRTCGFRRWLGFEPTMAFIIAPIIGAAIAAGLYASTHKPVEVISAREAERALATEQAARKSA